MEVFSLKPPPQLRMPSQKARPFATRVRIRAGWQRVELGSQGSFPARVYVEDPSLVERISENEGEFEFGSQKFVWAPCHGQKSRSQGTLKSLVVWADDLRLQEKLKLR